MGEGLGQLLGLDTIFQRVAHNSFDAAHASSEEGVRALLKLDVGAVEVISIVVHVDQVWIEDLD
jgi:hypothetical protein